MRGEDLDADNRVLFGDPADLVPRIRDLEENMGVDFLLMEVAQGGAPPDKVMKALDLFGREVLPHVQGKKKALAGAGV